MVRSLIAGFVCATLVAGVATAQPDAEHSVRLRVTPADLHTQEGARVLASRIRAAAFKVCNVDLPADYDACSRVAIQHAVAGLDAPLVTAALGLSGEKLSESRR